jgi:hypothetical protein
VQARRSLCLWFSYPFLSPAYKKSARLSHGSQRLPTISDSFGLGRSLPYILVRNSGGYNAREKEIDYQSINPARNATLRCKRKGNIDRQPINNPAINDTRDDGISSCWYCFESAQGAVQPVRATEHIRPGRRCSAAARRAIVRRARHQPRWSAELHLARYAREMLGFESSWRLYRIPTSPSPWIMCCSWPRGTRRLHLSPAGTCGTCTARGHLGRFLFSGVDVMNNKLWTATALVDGQRMQVRR